MGDTLISTGGHRQAEAWLVHGEEGPTCTVQVRRAEPDGRLTILHLVRAQGLVDYVDGRPGEVWRRSLVHASDMRGGSSRWLMGGMMMSAGGAPRGAAAVIKWHAMHCGLP